MQNYGGWGTHYAYFVNSFKVRNIHGKFRIEKYCKKVLKNEKQWDSFLLLLLAKANGTNVHASGK